MRAKHSRLSQNQEGFAAIVIAMTLILILSLTTVGFATLMRKEERNATDKYLREQAFRAAESGVNDATKAINAGYAKSKPDCKPIDAGATDPGASFLKNNKISGDTSISYTCLLMDHTPDDLEFSAIEVDQSKVVKVSAVNPDTGAPELIKDIVIGWQDVDGGANFKSGSSRDFTPAASWAYTGVLRVGLTPLSSGNTRNDLINSTYTAFLYPNAAGAANTTVTSSIGDGLGRDGGVLLDGNCHQNSAPRNCNVKITGLGQTNYLLSLRSIYRKSRVTVVAYGYTGQQLPIANAQTLVDATGKAEDVLRRIQVRIPSQNNYAHTDYPLETNGNICKQLNLYPDAGSNSSCTP